MFVVSRYKTRTLLKEDKELIATLPLAERFISSSNIHNVNQTAQSDLGPSIITNTQRQ